ncbi:MAG TPA: NAD(P)H-binding protein [Thermoleophilaceae bacterium]|nr:NAD(P)H-binding protein [Thermoleophilaceae bacterium]
MILLTGASGTVGKALLRRLTAEGRPVRCLVRDPRRLGSERVRVQIALGDLAVPGSFRNALRGVDTVIHLAAAIRDQPTASIEELNGVATLRLVRAAERARVGRFVSFSAIGASPHAPARFFRAKAIAERRVLASELDATVLAPSIVYAPGDPWLTILERLSYLPVMPLPGRGRALYQPIWADDVAACVVALLDRGEAGPGSPRRLELAGPETLSHEAIVRAALRSFGRPRPIVKAPLRLVRAGLRGVEWVAGDSAFATWEEAKLLEIPMTSSRGSADVESLGVEPRSLGEVLGAA